MVKLYINNLSERLRIILIEERTNEATPIDREFYSKIRKYESIRDLTSEER